MRECRMQRSWHSEEKQVPSAPKTATINLNYDQVALDNNIDKEPHVCMHEILPGNPRPNFPITPRVRNEIQAVAARNTSHSFGSKQQRRHVWPTPVAEDAVPLIPSRPPPISTGVQV